MLGIASVITNRATLGNVTPEDVVSAPGQFSAYGKSLPAGAEEFRGLAEQAWGTAQTIGPVTPATYYSTPAAARNLPGGLEPVDQTTGHVYHVDPQNRAFRTAKGFVQPTAELVANVAQRASQTARAVASGAINAVGNTVEAVGNVTARTGRGLAALAPNGLLGPRAQPSVSFDRIGPNRPNPPQQGITDIAQSAVNDVLGPDYSIDVISGTEGSLPQYGSTRHKTGLAADIQIKDPTGRTLNAIRDKQAMLDVAQAMAAKGAKGIGIGSNYMGATGIHVDQVTPGPGQDYEWGNIGNANAGLLADARQFKEMPASFYDKTMPQEMAAPRANPGPLESEYQKMASTMQEAGVRGLGAPQTYSAPVGKVARAALGPVSAGATPGTGKLGGTARAVANQPAARSPAYTSALAEMSAMTQNPARARYDALPEWGKAAVAASDIGGLVANAATVGYVDKAAAGARSLFSGKTYEQELADLTGLTRAAERRAGMAGLAARLTGGPEPQLGPAPRSTFENMVAGMDSPVYGPGQIAPSSAPQKSTPSPVRLDNLAFAGPKGTFSVPSKPSAPTTADLAAAYGQLATMADVGIANLSGAPLAAPQKPSLEQVAAVALRGTPAPALSAPKTVKTQTIAPPQKQTLAVPQQAIAAPLTTIGAFPTAPAPPKSKIPERVAKAALGGLLGGIPGAALGALSPEISKTMGGLLGGLGGLFGNAPNPQRSNFGTGLQAMSDILGGGGTAGATAYSRSTPGYSVTNLGNGWVEKQNQFGVKSYEHTGFNQSLFGGGGMFGGGFGSGRDASKAEANRGDGGVSSGGRGLW
ncbi:hypothetical protein [Neomesorhizobium albiziae]|nr:hypothetical protein [Mesorhizobium albiziae]GLS29301.1 hypothetical protein GCM10007937_10090 [Mesorhizobium albiziae]